MGSKKHCSCYAIPMKRCGGCTEPPALFLNATIFLLLITFLPEMLLGETDLSATGNRLLNIVGISCSYRLDSIERTSLPVSAAAESTTGLPLGPASELANLIRLDRRAKQLLLMSFGIYRPRIVKN